MASGRLRRERAPGPERARGSRKGGRANGRRSLLRPFRTIDRAQTAVIVGTLALVGAILFALTPYTQYLDEIKNTLLLSLSPFLLLAVVWFLDLSKLRWTSHWPDALLGLFVGAMILSFLANPAYRGPSERVLWFQVSCVAFALAFAWHIRSESHARRVFLVLLGLMLASIGIGLLLYAGHGFTAAVYDSVSRSAFWRAHPDWISLAKTFRDRPDMHSTILNPDFFAAFLVMMLFIPLSVFFAVDRVRLRIVALITFLLGNVCIFFANSNDSFLALVLVGYPLYATLVARHAVRWRPSRRFLVTAVAGCAVIGVSALILMIPTLSAAWDFKTDALEGRKILWLGGLQAWLFRDDPTMSHIDWWSVLFGTGPGGYRFFFPLFRRPDWFDNQINNVTTFGHNWYVDVLCEYGLAGFMTFMAFLGGVVWNGIRQVRRGLASGRGPVVPLFQAAVTAGLCGVAVQNLFSPNNRWAVDATIYWSLLGVSMGLWRLDHAAAPESHAEVAPLRAWRPRVARACLVGLACLFALRSVPQGLRHFDCAIHHRAGSDLLVVAGQYESPTREQLYDRSRAQLVEAIRANPVYPSSYYKLGSAYHGLGRTDDAIRTYRQLERIDPHYSEIHLNLGMLYREKASRAGNPAQGLADMETAYTEAREAARQSLRPNTQATSGIICQELAALYGNLGRQDDARRLLEEARTYYRNIVEYTPRAETIRAEHEALRPTALKTLIHLSNRTGHVDEATVLLRKRYDENPADETALAELLGHYERHAKPGEKERFLTEALRGDPLSVKLRRQRADALRASGDTGEYRRELERIAVLEGGPSGPK